MSSREIIKSNDVSLHQNEKGQYIVGKFGLHSYAIKPESRTYSIVRIFDNRCLAQQRRYECANDVIEKLSTRLQEIEKSKVYRFFHLFGVI